MQVDKTRSMHSFQLTKKNIHVVCAIFNGKAWGIELGYYISALLLLTRHLCFIEIIAEVTFELCFNVVFTLSLMRGDVKFIRSIYRV